MWIRFAKILIKKRKNRASLSLHKYMEKTSGEALDMRSMNVVVEELSTSTCPGHSKWRAVVDIR